MPRPAQATVCLVLAGCAVHDPTPAPAFGGRADSQPESLTAAVAADGSAHSAGSQSSTASIAAALPGAAPGGESASVPGGGEVLLPVEEADAAAPALVFADGDESALRNELARAADPIPAALGLVRLLDGQQRLGEALAVVEAARRRRPDDRALAVARAGLLRDLGRRSSALAALLDLQGAAGADGLETPLLFELAELAWLEDRRDLARAAVQQLQQRSDGDRGTRQTREFAQLRARVDSSAPPLAVRARDVFGDLRGAPTPAARQAALARLVGVGGAMAQRTWTIALDDPEPTLRSSAVANAAVAAAALPEFCAVALSDRAPEVRIAGARRATALAVGDAVALLLPVLISEQESTVFAALHAALRAVTGAGKDVAAEAFADPATRAEVVAEWRMRWER